MIAQKGFGDNKNGFLVTNNSSPSPVRTPIFFNKNMGVVGSEFSRILQILYTFRILITKRSRSCESSRCSLSHPARCFLWSENIAPPHKSEKEQRSLLFLGSRFCAPARNRTSNNGLEVRSYIHLTTGAWCAMRDLNPRPFRCKRIALPTELIAQIKQNIPVAESYHIFRKIQ